VAESLVNLNRGAEAIPIIDECVWRASGKGFDPHLLESALSLRLQHFETRKDAAGWRQSAVMWEKLNRTDADSLYNAACYRAVTAAVVGQTPGTDATGLAREEADRAMAWLKQAVAAGYKDVAHIKEDKDLDVLRDREDFQALLKTMEAGPKRTRKAGGP
jgi:hypothetical protein